MGKRADLVADVVDKGAQRFDVCIHVGDHTLHQLELSDRLPN